MIKYDFMLIYNSFEIFLFITSAGQSINLNQLNKLGILCFDFYSTEDSVCDDRQNLVNLKNYKRIAQKQQTVVRDGYSRCFGAWVTCKLFSDDPLSLCIEKPNFQIDSSILHEHVFF